MRFSSLFALLLSAGLSPFAFSQTEGGMSASETEWGAKIGGAKSEVRYYGSVILKDGVIPDWGLKPTTTENLKFKCASDAPYAYAFTKVAIYCLDLPPAELKSHISPTAKENYELRVYDSEAKKTLSYAFVNGEANPAPDFILPEKKGQKALFNSKAVKYPTLQFVGFAEEAPEGAVPIDYDCNGGKGYAVEYSSWKHVHCVKPRFFREPLNEAARECAERFMSITQKDFGKWRIRKNFIDQKRLDACADFISNRMEAAVTALDESLWPLLLVTLESDAYFEKKTPELAAVHFCNEAVELAKSGRENVVKAATEASRLRGFTAKYPKVKNPGKYDFSDLADTTAKDANIYGLSQNELGAVGDYGGANYYFMNQALRTGEMDEKLRTEIEYLRSALFKTPEYKGVVRRGAQLPAEAAAEHVPGAVVDYKAFTSTSKAKTWDWGGKHRFLIYSAHGRLIEDLTGIKNEEEVLFDAGTKFKILDVHPVEQDYTEIIMREVP